MGLFKHVVIESKVFSILKEGSSRLIIEKSWKVVKELRLGLTMVQWVAKTLEQCLKKERKDFYTPAREGNRSFIVQWCSNARGRYTVLVEIWWW